MPFYSTADQIYQCTQVLFNRVLEASPDVAEAIKNSRLIIRLHCTQPEAEVTLNGRQQPVQYTFGPSSQKPDLDVRLEADTLHEILLDHLGARQALTAGLMKVKGPIWKVNPLVELLRQGRAFYPDVLREEGLLPGPDNPLPGLAP